MARHSKAKKAQLEQERRAEELLRLRQQEIENEERLAEEVQSICSQNRKATTQGDTVAKVKKATTPRKANKQSHNQAASHQDGIAIAQRLRNANVDNQSTPFEIVKLLEKAAHAVSALGDAEDVEKCLTEDAHLDAEASDLLRKHCQILKTSLQNLGSVSDIPSVRASTLRYYGQHMLYRNGSLLYLLTVAEAFKSTLPFSNRGMRKTFGFVRAEGTIDPLACSISGFLNVVEEHPKMLDTENGLRKSSTGPRPFP